MITKIHRAWRYYCKHWSTRLDHELAIVSRESTRKKFENYVCNLIKTEGEISFDWQENGDCIVMGVVYLTLIDKIKVL